MCCAYRDLGALYFTRADQERTVNCLARRINTSAMNSKFTKRIGAKFNASDNINSDRSVPAGVYITLVDKYMGRTMLSHA